MSNSNRLTNNFCLKSLIIITLIAIIRSELSDTKLNLFVNSDEVQKLVGLNAEIFYIKKGEVNKYALGFVLTVPTDFSEQRFSWNASIPSVSYRIGFRISDGVALEVPKINISDVGYVPIRTESFSVFFVCSGRTNAEVDVQLLINITTPAFFSKPNQTTELILKRKKICKKSDVRRHPIPNDKSVDKTEDKRQKSEESVAASSPQFESTSPLYIALTCASAFVLLVALLALLCYFLYVRTQKDRQTPDCDLAASLTNLSSSKSGQTYIRGDTPNHPTISKTGGHYSSVRGLLNAHTIAPPVSLYRTLSVPVGIQSEHKRTHKLNQQMSDLSIERRKILLQQKLCEGTFGRIYTGIYVSNYSDMTAETKVIIKTVSDQASKLQISLVMTEGMRFYGLTHRNLMTISGTSTDDPHRPLLIYPFMTNGVLKQFLLNSSANKLSCDGQYHKFTTQDLVQMALQIASAIIYLHKKRIIHRDLSTRNCFVTTDDDNSLLVRVADNALSRDLFPNDYHCLGDNENRPIKWLALESLSKREFTQFSDVWSFGVTLWELMTLGQQPYAEVDPYEMAAYLRDGYRLYQPINCPDKLYDIMICCWSAEPNARPKFPELLSCLEDFHQTLGKYI